MNKIPFEELSQGLIILTMAICDRIKAEGRSLIDDDIDVTTDPETLNYFEVCGWTLEEFQWEYGMRYPADPLDVVALQLLELGFTEEQMLQIGDSCEDYDEMLSKYTALHQQYKDLGL